MEGSRLLNTQFSAMTPLVETPLSSCGVEEPSITVGLLPGCVEFSGLRRLGIEWGGKEFLGHCRCVVVFDI